MISHAMMFPNKRAEIETILASSLIRSIIPRKISRNPIARAHGVRALKSGAIFIKPPMYLTGAMMIAAAFARITTNSPSAIGRAK